MRASRNRTSFHHPKIEDNFRLSVRVVETLYTSEFATEAQICRDKIAEQERLEQTHPRPKRLIVPNSALGSSEAHYVDLPQELDEEDAA